MMVRTLGSGREVAGLYVGSRNARRYFPRERKHIELLLGHLHIYCDLTEEFWQSKPEICDARLADWLFSRIFHGKVHQAPAPIELIPHGQHGFRVLPFAVPAASVNGLARIGPPRGAGHDGDGRAKHEPGTLAQPRSFVPSVARMRQK
jgi:hypothetical protein